MKINNTNPAVEHILLELMEAGVDPYQTTQQELGRIVGLSQPTICRLFSHESAKITPHVLNKFSRFLRKTKMEVEALRKELCRLNAVEHNRRIRGEESKVVVLTLSEGMHVLIVRGSGTMLLEGLHVISLKQGG